MEDFLTKSPGIADVVYAIAASPGFVQDGICFAACQSGLSRSGDRGLTWHAAYESLRLEGALATAALALSPDFDIDHTVFSGVQGAVLRSTDGGANWQVVTLPTPPPQVSSLVVSPGFAQDGTVLAGTLEDGVFRSTDRGRHWTAWNFGLLDLNTLALAISPAFAGDDTLFVATESGIFRSTNGGRAWRETAFPVQWAPVLSLALSPNYASDGTLFAGTEAQGLLVSQDRGAGWRPIGEGVVDGAVNALSVSLRSSGLLAILAVLADRVLLSGDGGETWVDCRVDPERDESFSTAAAPHGTSPGSLLLVGTTKGRILNLTIP